MWVKNFILGIAEYKLIQHAEPASVAVWIAKVWSVSEKQLQANIEETTFQMRSLKESLLSTEDKLAISDSEKQSLNLRINSLSEELIVAKADSSKVALEKSEAARKQLEEKIRQLDERKSWLSYLSVAELRKKQIAIPGAQQEQFSARRNPNIPTIDFGEHLPSKAATKKVPQNSLPVKQKPPKVVHEAKDPICAKCYKVTNSDSLVPPNYIIY